MDEGSCHSGNNFPLFSSFLEILSNQFQSGKCHQILNDWKSHTQWISDPRVMSAWAHYISLFVSAYENHGVPIWAITPQNEPEFPAPWEACSYNASFESYFVEKFLGPVMKSEHPDIKILAFDHNKDHLYSWAQTMLFPSSSSTSSSSASQSNQLSQYVDGMAFHWYGGTGDRLLDGTYGYDTVNQTYHLAPDKILMATEGCSCPGMSTFTLPYLSSYQTINSHSQTFLFNV